MVVECCVSLVEYGLCNAIPDHAFILWHLQPTAMEKKKIGDEIADEEARHVSSHSLPLLANMEVSVNSAYQLYSTLSGAYRHESD
jgi:hypothetical protein